MRITKLDGLRGIFSLMVVFYHYPTDFIPHSFHDFFFISKSYLFVDFFFVLSGFVITYNYHNSINSKGELGTFVRKRIIRLYPLLLFSTLIFFFVTIGVKIFLPQFANSKDSFLPAIVDTFNTLLFLNSTPVIDDNYGGNPYGMNYPSWSISAEMFAYLFFGVVFLLATKQKRNSILALAIPLGMAFLMIKSLSGIESNFDFVRGIVSFNIGYFVYRYSDRKLPINHKWEFALMAIFAGLLYLASVAKTPFTVVILESTVIPLFFGLFIYVLLYTNGVLSAAIETAPFQFLGKISYSVYLNHAILVHIVPRVFFSFFGIQPTPTFQIIVMLTNVALVIFYSYVTYNVIEIQGGNMLRKLWSDRLSTPNAEPAKS